MENTPKSRPEEKPSNKWLKRIWGMLPFVVLILMAFGIWILFSRIEARQARLKAQAVSGLHQEETRPHVVALKIVPKPIRDRIRFPGVTMPSKKVNLLAEVKGKVVRKAAEEGVSVKTGDLIAALDSRDYENALSAADAAYAAADAELKRIESLFQQKAVAQAQLDDAVARVRSLKSNRDNAALALQRCTLLAPLAGVVNRIYVEEGDFVGVGDPVAEIIQIDPVKVQVGIPESDVEAVRKRAAFQVVIDALGSKVFTAKKDFLSKTADPMARLYNLNLILKNPSHEILPDMFAKVEIIRKEVPNAASVPLYAVINRNDENVVYVVNDDHVHARKVTLGLMEGWKIEIKSGLKPGDRVIVVGHRDVNPGQQVTVVKTVEQIEDLSS
jgi:RND family efflux transporter MFP subunit